MLYKFYLIFYYFNIFLVLISHEILKIQYAYIYTCSAYTNCHIYAGTSCTSHIISLYNMQHVENPIWTWARNFPSRSSNTRSSLGTNAITICWYLSWSVWKFVESNESFRWSSLRWRTSFPRFCLSNILPLNSFIWYMSALFKFPCFKEYQSTERIHVKLKPWT